MKTTRTFLGVCALLLIANPTFSQEEKEDRKVTVDIEIEENGETKKVKRDFYLKEGQSLEEALKELGIMDELGEIDSDERLEIDIRRFMEDEEEGNMMFRFYNNDGNGMLYGDCGPKPFLGVHYDTDGKNGVTVTKVVEGTAAEKAGLQEGDVITKINKEAVTENGSFGGLICEREIGEEISITYLRNGKKRMTTATLGEKKNSGAFMWKSQKDSDDHLSWALSDDDENEFFSDEPRAFLGVEGKSNENGMEITRVVDGTAAQDAGLRAGDVIHSVNNTEVHSIGELADELNTQKPGDEIDLRVNRDGKKMKMKATLGERKGHAKVRKFHFDSGENNFDFDFDFDFDTKEMTKEQREDFEEAMQDLKEEMKELKERFHESKNEWKEDFREMRVIIIAEELTEDEKEMLQEKGVANLDRELDVDLNLFPNPSDGLFTLDFDTGKNGDLGIEVYDSAGNQVYMERLIDVDGDYKGRIDLTDRADGNYYLVVSQDGRSVSRKLTKH